MSVSGIGGGGTNVSQWWLELQARNSASATSAASSTSSSGTTGTETTLAAAMAQAGVQSMTAPSGTAPMNAQESNAFQQGMSTIGSALQSGDVSGAQDGFAQASAALSKSGVHHHHHHGAKGAAAGASGSTTDAGTDPFAQAFAQLGGALQSGDTTGAQTAFQQLQSLLGSSASPLTTTSPVLGIADPTGGAVDVLA